MSRIERRLFMQRATAGAFACSTSLLIGQANGQSRPGTWPNRRLLDLFKVEHPIIQAPMGGHVGIEMVIAVAEAGGIGSLPTAWLGPKQIRDDVEKIRSRVRKPVNLNFFCHSPPKRDEATESAWRRRLAPYYAELGVADPGTAREYALP